MKDRILNCSVSALVALALVLGTAGGTAHADILFASTGLNNTADNFGTLDTATGIYTPLGNSQVTLAGLGALNGVLYGAAYNAAGGTLYTVDTANGNLTAVGNSNVAYLTFASAANGLWAIGTDDNLYAIDPSSGGATLKGSIGLTPNSGNWNSLASGLSFLFYDFLDGLYTLEPSNGASTFVGCAGVGATPAQCSGPQMSAMGASGGIVYGIDSTVAGGLYTLDAGTGKATATFPISGTGNFVSGLSAAPTAPVSGVPAPGALSLFGVGAAVLLAIRRRTR